MRAAHDVQTAATMSISSRRFASLVITLLVAGCGGGTALGPDGGGGDGGGGGTTGSAGHTGSGGATGSGGVTGGAGHPGGGSTGAGGHAACGPVCDIYCEYGNVPDANGCPTCKCNPPPTTAACTTQECGPEGTYAGPNCLGTIIPGTCSRGADGKCAWSAPTCKSICPAIACAFACPYGAAPPDANGCPSCACNRCPNGYHEVACDTIACAQDCVYGYERGTDGCSTCTCRKAPTCAGPAATCVYCPFGYRAGPNGCSTCECENPPSGCAQTLTR